MYKNTVPCVNKYIIVYPFIFSKFKCERKWKRIYMFGKRRNSSFSGRFRSDRQVGISRHRLLSQKYESVKMPLTGADSNCHQSISKNEVLIMNVPTVH